MKARTYQESKLQHTEHLRQMIVSAAGVLLQEHGPDAVTIRKVADKMECSTKIIYKVFSNKDGLLQLLYLEGCKLLAERFESVPRHDKIEQSLRELCQAYWEFGLNDTSYYQLMFGGAFGEFKPEEDSMYATSTALQQFTAVITEAIEAGVILEKDAKQVVHVIWASLHGVIHLYLGGHIKCAETAKSLFDNTVTNLIHTYMQG